jgi:hypothetical protein
LIINVTDRRGMSASQPTQRSTAEVVKVAQGVNSGGSIAVSRTVGIGALPPLPGQATFDGICLHSDYYQCDRGRLKGRLWELRDRMVHVALP